MTSLELKLYQKRLRKYLSAAPFESFARMIWAVDAIQSKRISEGSKHISFPTEAATTDMLSKFKVHGWELEDLWNEYFATPPKRLRKNNNSKLLNCAHWDTFRHLMGTLRDMNNAESGVILSGANILQEMPKVAFRQLDWQRGFFTPYNFYRASFLFGGPKAKMHLEKITMVPFDHYTKIVFALFALFREQPVLNKNISGEPIGVSDKEVAHVINHISATSDRISRIALKTKKKYPFSSQRPSVLRQVPVVQFGIDNEYIACPLIEVLAWQITEGLYYDTVGDDGGLRNEISARFEDYCRTLLTAQTSSFEISKEFSYGLSKKKKIPTPDILIRQKGCLRIVLECKQKRLSFDAVFEHNDSQNDVPGIKEIIKGVFQLWKFFSHVRRGLVRGERLDREVVGVVLTLDPWLVMTRGRRQHILEEARKLVSEHEPEIEKQDMRSVAFCYIKDLESLLVCTNDTTLVSTLESAANDEFAGWLLQSIHNHKFPNVNERKPFPFKDRIDQVLPWWGENKDVPIKIR